MSFISTKNIKGDLFGGITAGIVASTTHRQVRWAHWLALWVQHFWAASPQSSVAHIHKSVVLRVQ